MFFSTPDNYPHPRPTTSTHYPRPTSFSYTPFSLTATTKIEPDTNPLTFVLTAARFWPQRWLAGRTMPQDLIDSWNKGKLKTHIPLVVVFENDQPSAERRIDFPFFVVVLWSYSRKICLNMCYGNSENSHSCSYLLRICFIYGTNVTVSQSWISLQVVDREQCAFWSTNKRVQIKILSISSLVSSESLVGNNFSEQGTQGEDHCERNLNHQLWRRKDEKYGIAV